MLIKKEEARRHESPACIVWEHDHLTDNLSYATALINGNYPEEGKMARNWILRTDLLFI